MRPTRDQWAMSLAKLTAERATCLRRKVGCVLLNALGHVVATGYNGVACGQPHCNDLELVGVDYKPWGSMPGLLKPDRMVESYPHACPGATAPSGQGLDTCEAIHAEQNALLQCRDVQGIHACYTTASPCMTCVKLLMNTGCKRILFLEAYPHPAAKDLWLSNPERSWEQLQV